MICFYPFREFQGTLDFRPIRDTDVVEDHQITVCVRKRPLNKKEINRKEVDVITVPSKDRLFVHEPKTKVSIRIFQNIQWLKPNCLPYPQRIFHKSFRYSPMNCKRSRNDPIFSESNFQSKTC